MTNGVIDVESGNYIIEPESTGFWICEIRLTEPDDDLSIYSI